MTNIKLVDGTIIEASNVEVVKGVLKITTSALTVEKLAKKFSDKSNTSLIMLLTESGDECGYKSGFTSFSGITYDSEGNKTIEMFQPRDVTELRISNAEATANKANNTSYEASELAMEASNASARASKAASTAESNASASLQLSEENSESLENLQAQVDYIAIMTEVE